MQSYKDAPKLMAEIELGGAAQEWPLYPQLDTQREPVLLPGESVLARQTAKRIAQEGYAIPKTEDLNELMRALQRPEFPVSLRQTSLILTTHRVIWIVDEDLGANRFAAGHIWHCWLQTVSFHPRQSFFIDSALILTFDQEFSTADGWFRHNIEFGFDKRFHPGEFAQQIAHTAARFNLGSGAPSDNHPELNALANAPVPPDPDKGESADFELPVWTTYPSVPAGVAPDGQAVWTDGQD